MAEQSSTLTELTVALVGAFVGNNATRPDELASLIRSTHAALAGLSEPVAAEPAPAETSPQYVPAVSIRKSLASHEHLISLIDGKPYRTLKRHLRSHGLTPDDYRQRYGLKDDYPMAAPAYVERRRDIANSIGLGRRILRTSPEEPASGSSSMGRRRNNRSAQSRSAPEALGIGEALKRSRARFSGSQAEE